MSANLNSGTPGTSDAVLPVEQEARALGWVPQDEFRGDPARWVDAETFVERGHSVMPILRQNNARLEAMLAKQAKEMENLRTAVGTSQETMRSLQEFHQQQLEETIKRTRAQTIAQIRAAKESGDVDLEMELTEQLADLSATQREIKNRPAQQPPQGGAASEDQGAPSVHPDFPAWQEQNQWFGTDQRRTMMATGIAQELRADPANDSLQGRAFFEKVVQVMEERTAPRGGKVEGGGRHTSSPASGGSGRRSYSDLPAAAKEVCDRQGKKFVGEGKLYNTVDEWRQYYVSTYFKGEEV